MSLSIFELLYHLEPEQVACHVQGPDLQLDAEQVQASGQKLGCGTVEAVNQVKQETLCMHGFPFPSCREVKANPSIEPVNKDGMSLRTGCHTLLSACVQEGFLEFCKFSGLLLE